MALAVSKHVFCGQLGISEEVFGVLHCNKRVKVANIVIMMVSMRSKQGKKSDLHMCYKYHRGSIVVHYYSNTAVIQE